MSAACRARTMARNSSRACRAIPGIVAVRGEEVQGHISPVVALLRVELVHGEQLDHSDPQLLQVRNPIHDPGVGPPPLRGDAASGAPREAADVHLVDHAASDSCRGDRSWSGASSGPARQDTQRRPTQVRARPPARPRGRTPVGRRPPSHRGRAGSSGGRRHASSRPGGARSVDSVGVVAGVSASTRQPAMPDVPCLVHPRIQPILEERMGGIVFAEKQQHHALGIPGVEREIVGALVLDPAAPGPRQDRAFRSKPISPEEDAPDSGRDRRSGRGNPTPSHRRRDHPRRRSHGLAALDIMASAPAVRAVPSEEGSIGFPASG